MTDLLPSCSRCAAVPMSSTAVAACETAYAQLSVAFGSGRALGYSSSSHRATSASRGSRTTMTIATPADQRATAAWPSPCHRSQERLAGLWLVAKAEGLVSCRPHKAKKTAKCKEPGLARHCHGASPQGASNFRNWLAARGWFGFFMVKCLLYHLSELIIGARLHGRVGHLGRWHLSGVAEWCEILIS